MDYFKKSLASLVDMSTGLMELGYYKLAGQIDDVAVKVAAFWDAESAHADEVDSRTNDETLSEQVLEDDLSVNTDDSSEPENLDAARDLVFECASDLKSALRVLQDTDNTEDFIKVVDAVHARLLDFFDSAEEADHVLQKTVDAVLDSSSVYGEERELVISLVFNSDPSEYLGE